MSRHDLFDCKNSKADLILDLQKLGYDGIKLLGWDKDRLISEVMIARDLTFDQFIEQFDS